MQTICKTELDESIKLPISDDCETTVTTELVNQMPHSLSSKYPPNTLGYLLTHICTHTLIHTHTLIQTLR